MKNNHPINPRLNTLIISLVMVALCIGIALWRLQPPTPLGADASPPLFSAVRAVEDLRQVLVDDTPHPVGSAADDRVRERLINWLEVLGYPIQSAISSSSILPTRRRPFWPPDGPSSVWTVRKRS